MTIPNTTNKSRAAAAKDNNARPSAASPPPAYTPRRLPDLAALTARAIQSRQGLASVAQVLQQNPNLQATLLDSAAAEEEHDPDSSPISLRINTSVNVTRSNNVVCLPATPADQANAIAQAVVKALHHGSSGMCGIPMIDENGAPRPLRIEVDAGLVVEGSGNIIGSRDLVDKAIEFRDASGSSRRPRDDDEDQDDDEENPAKRQRSSQ
ncbi:hypothetical protein AK830_g4974 [Neonectria ditissima]|uniref:Uncharacterized protein n=1 Tax=Neonectria ditissima TaxID=78410 RepID=A0A0P7BLV8_9HYPO|nr:hypothetical protein AK830_g4974 [Neonectria ditissima]